ncbi:SDR family NAD(P)-dependent oxidoreductase [Delftia tsuruhatensis]
MSGLAHAPFSLQGKTILVTGASSGLGRQTAITCAQRGAHVIITGRNADRLQDTFAQLQGTGHVLAVADLTSAADRERLVTSAPR